MDYDRYKRMIEAAAKGLVIYGTSEVPEHLKNRSGIRHKENLKPIWLGTSIPASVTDPR